MKNLERWSLVGPVGRTGRQGGHESGPRYRLSAAVLRCFLAGPSREFRLGPGLADRMNRLATYLRASLTLHPFRFGGSYDRA